MINFDEYQTAAQRTANKNAYDIEKIMNGCLGLAGESGECCDILKKNMFQGHKLDEEHLIEELGDVLWYCAELASGLGIALGEVAERNILKLKKRYPEGFDPERSIHRDGCS